MTKLYVCYKTNPRVWGGIQMAGLALLTRCELERYRDFIPEDKDLQEECDVAMGDPEKYVSLLVGQKNGDEQQA